MTDKYRIPVLETFGFQPSVKSRRASPPIAPSRGDRYIVIPTATGAWAGKENKIVYCSNVAGPIWNFDTPSEGWLTWVEDANAYYSFNSVNWVVLETTGDSGGLVWLEKNSVY